MLLLNYLVMDKYMYVDIIWKNCWFFKKVMKSIISIVGNMVLYW